MESRPTEPLTGSLPPLATEEAVAGSTSATTSTPPLDADGKPLSKNQQKKLKKKQEWEEGRPARKELRKEKLKARKERKRERAAAELAGEVDAGNGKTSTGDKDAIMADDGAAQDGIKSVGVRREKPKPRKTVQLPITFLFDCAFDDLMTDGELMSLGSQLTRCYSDNKKALFKAHLAVSSFGGKLKARYDGILNKQYKSWQGFRFLEDDFVAVAEKAKEWMRDEKTGGVVAGALAKEGAVSMNNAPADEKNDKEDSAQEAAEETQPASAEQYPDGEVVYLTADSPNTLHTLSPYSTYIIGGIIDRNRHKGICYKRATERGIKTAKLPIGEYMHMLDRHVLATNHVNEIMVNWLEDGDWGKSFMKVIPQRKGGVLKGEGEPSGKAGHQKEGKRSRRAQKQDQQGKHERAGEEGEGANDEDEEAVIVGEARTEDEEAEDMDEEPVTAENQLDVAGREGQIVNTGSLKRKVDEVDDATTVAADATKKPRAEVIEV